MFRSPRKVAPTFKTLSEREETSREKLISILTNAEDNLLAAGDIRSAISRIKDACNIFERDSKNLSQWFTTNGSFQDNSETRNCRVKLIHSHCREAVKSLNGRLLEVNEEIASSIGDSAVD